MENIASTCAHNCRGNKNAHGECCTIEDRNWIIGRIGDVPELLKNLEIKYGRPFTEEEVVISFEEGSKMFPERPIWQEAAYYPAMRVNMDSVRKPCIFYNEKLRVCTIHEIRPATCRDFLCDYLKARSNNVINS